MSRVAMFLVLWGVAVPALAVDYSISMTWQHDGLDTAGDPENLAAWHARVLDPSGAELDAQTLSDPLGQSREWELLPIELHYGVEYTVELVAVDEAGNVSEPAKATLRLEDATPPSAPSPLNITVNCPPGRECNVTVNGVLQ